MTDEKIPVPTAKASYRLSLKYRTQRLKLLDSELSEEQCLTILDIQDAVYHGETSVKHYTRHNGYPDFDERDTILRWLTGLGYGVSSNVKRDSIEYSIDWDK